MKSFFILTFALLLAVLLQPSAEMQKNIDLAVLLNANSLKMLLPSVSFTILGLCPQISLSLLKITCVDFLTLNLSSSWCNLQLSSSSFGTRTKS